jgi:hypothetical protein
MSDNSTHYSSELLNKPLSYRFTDLKPGSSTLLASERSVRLLNNLNSSKVNSNFTLSDNNLNALVSTSLENNLSVSQENLFNNSSVN